MAVKNENNIEKVITVLKIAKDILDDEIVKSNTNYNNKLENLLMEADMYISKGMKRLEKAKVNKI